MRGLLAAVLIGAQGCVTPLSNRIDVGNEAFVVVAGEGAGGIVDLFAAPAEGGLFRQLTFTRAAEELPRLGPSGTTIAFARDAVPVILDLVTGQEMSSPLPAAAGPVAGFGWNPAGDTVVARAGESVWWSAAAELHWAAVPEDRRADGLRWTGEQVGAEGFGVLAPCGGGGPGWCIVTASGETALDAEATDPIRWGPSAVGYLLRGRLEIRPLGGGRIRQPTWAEAPGGLRHPTYHPGTGAAAR